ncbi:MAG TPA: hypothetical protein VGP07_03925 [Polyangia bacterium]|jgi:hypothetical protein
MTPAAFGTKGRLKHGGWSLAALAGFCALGMSCASTTLPLTASERTPAAKGTVKTSTDAQGNTKLTVAVDYLPRPADLAPDLSTFVVWSVSDDGGRVRNLGQLNIDKDRQGSVTLVSPLARFRLVITAEENGTAEKPSKYTILEGMVAPKS